MSTAPRPSFTEHEFRKATRSDPDKECVRVARRNRWVELRDDKKRFGTPEDRRLAFTDEEFDAYLTGARAGKTDGLWLEITRRGDGMYLFRHRGKAGVELEFTKAEVVAFLDGVAKHEFDAIAYAA